MANFQLGDSQKVDYQLLAKDAKGEPALAQPGDTITIASSDLAMATVVPDATPVAGSVASGFIVAGNAVGTVTINASYAPADGSPAFTASQLIDIGSGKTASVALNLGTAVAQ